MIIVMTSIYLSHKYIHMHLDNQSPQQVHSHSNIQQGTESKPQQTPARGTFKRVISAECPELETTICTSNASRTIPSISFGDEQLILDEQVKRVCLDEGISEEDDRFSIRFRKVEMSPSALLEKGRLRNEEWEDLLVLCIIIFGGKTVEVRCRVTAGELQFSNGCAIRLSKVTKMKVAYEEYQKCLWLTYQDTTRGRPQQAKLRMHVPDDVKDDLYLLFAHILIQKLALMGQKINASQMDDDKEDRFKMAGSILKKSQFLGKWAQRKMVVSDRIESFRCGKCTFAMRDIRQVWTRFDLFEEKVIIKVRHGSEKTELGIPIVNYAARFCKENWLYRIYRLVSAVLI